MLRGHYIRREPGSRGAHLQVDYTQPTPMSRLRALLPVLYLPLVLLVTRVIPDLYGKHVYPLPLCEAVPWIRLEAVLVLLVILTPAGFFFLRGWRTLRHGQYPAPGTPVFFRRPIQRGWLARLQGASLLAIATLLFALTIYVAVLFQLHVLFFEPCTSNAHSALAACKEALTFRR